MTSRILALIVLSASLALNVANAEITNQVILRATRAIDDATPRANADPTKPLFHITSPAQWINDPNGPIYYHGWYHVFYQLSPYSDHGGPKYWGHVRSHDLAKWERLPIAVWPSGELNETEIWSGCCTVNGEGKPMIFYTSIAAGTSPGNHAEQWAATSDDDLMTWQKSPANPVLSESLHGDRKVFDWRDPFVFRDGKKTFLITGGNLNEAKGGQATVNIYEAQNAALTQWKYRGILFQPPGARTVECPNFFKLGDKYVLFMSPYGKVQYFIGDFDATTCRFTPQTNGILDFGQNFYAPNTMLVPDGRRLVWGWVNGFPNGRGWNGCLTVPRLLAISHDGQLLQKPAPQLSKLRDRGKSWKNIALSGAGESFALPKTNTLELLADIDLNGGNQVELQLKSGTGSTAPIVIAFDGSKLKVADQEAPLSLVSNQRKLNLRVFIDRSVLEVFANETAVITKVITPLDDAPVLQIHSDSNSAKAKLIQAWPLKSIW